MAISILVVDAAPHFATLVRQSLEETRAYQACVAGTAKEALELFRSADIHLVIVDFDLPDMAGGDLVKELRRSKPDVPVIGIPLGSEAPETLEGLGLSGTLKKPFYLPDLLDLVGQALGKPDAVSSLTPRRPGPIQHSPAQRTPAAIPAWLSTQEEAERRLQELFPATTALGIVIARGRAIWASAGRLDRKQLYELSSVLGDLWAGEGMYGSLAKYIRLPSSREELMLYASPIAGEFMLALVSSADATFIQIRREALNLTKGLTQGEAPAADAGGAMPRGIGPAERVEHLPADWQPHELQPGEARRGLVEYALETEAQEPAKGSAAAGEEDSVPLPPDWIPSHPPPSTHPGAPGAPAIQPAVPTQQAAAAQEPTRAQELPLPCTIVLTPRSATLQMSGPLLESLTKWSTSLSAARGWKVEGIAAQADFLCLTLSHLPAPANRTAIEEFCSALSGEIAGRFPDLARDLPGGRFWATRFLLLKGGPYPTEVIARAVQRARASAAPHP